MLIWLGLPLSALAAGIPAEQGAELLARAQSLDAKCNFLDARGRDKLSKFTARAELALANRESMAATKATMKRGHEAGAAADCSAAEKVTVQQILAAAMQAAGEDNKAVKLAKTPAPAAADVQAQQNEKPANAEVKQVATAPGAETKLASNEPPFAPPMAMPVKVKKLAETKPAKPLKPKLASPGLGTYERLTQAYYLARRCGGMNIGNTYQAVVAEHGRVMASHSAAEVSAVLHQAEARAGSATCS